MAKLSSLRLVSIVVWIASASLVAGCGSSGKANDGGKDAPHDVASHPETGPETSPDSASPSDSGADVAADAAPDVVDAATEAGTDADAAPDAPADVAADTAAPDGGADVALFDAGLGCQPPPATEAPLVPATEGVPAQGLALWVRADRGIYMTPGAGAVCAWADQTSSGRVLTNAGGRPSWEPGTVGGKAGVHFGTAAAALATGGPVGIGATSGRTFVAVVASVSTTKRFQPVFQGKSGTPGTYVGIDTNTFQTAGSREGVYVTNNAYDSTLATSTEARVHVFTVSTMTAGTPVLSAIDYRVNGVAQTLTRTAGGLGNGNIESFATADFTSVGSAGGDAIVAEALIYDRALSGAERTAIETALMARYGITASDAGSD